jgi:hypothetical protein
MEFKENFVDFTSENGGEISIELMKKIPAMADYEELLVEFRIEEVNSSKLNSVSIFASKDGLHWDSVPRDATWKAVQFSNPDYSYKYLKAVANITFYSNGKVRWSYTKIEGLRNESSVGVDKPDAVDVFVKSDPFHIYSHSKTINVVSPDDDPFTILITNMNGSIVFYEKVTGNKRIDSEFPDGLYVVHLLRDDKVISTRKIVL